MPMGTQEGALKTAARRSGVSLDDYLLAIQCGQKRCTKCKAWRDTGAFDVDKSRWDGFASVCCYCRRVAVRKRRKLPAPSTEIHNAATNAVRTAVRRGRLALVTTLPCFDCGGSAQQYHHYLGYERIHWLDVQALCRSCHQKRHW
jgi:hypothetical protein